MKTKIFVLGVMLLSTGVYGTNCVEEDTFNMDMKRQPNVLIHTHTISYPKGSHHSLRTSPVMMAYAREMEKIDLSE